MHTTASIHCRQDRSWLSITPRPVDASQNKLNVRDIDAVKVYIRGGLAEEKVVLMEDIWFLHSLLEDEVELEVRQTVERGKEEERAETSRGACSGA